MQKISTNRIIASGPAAALTGQAFIEGQRLGQKVAIRQIRKVNIWFKFLIIGPLATDPRLRLQYTEGVDHYFLLAQATSRNSSTQIAFTELATFLGLMAGGLKSV